MAPNEASELPVKEMQAALRLMGKLDKPVAKEATRLAAEAINSEAQVVSPIDKGFLKGSHIPIADGDDMLIGATANYSAAVHERHPTNPRWYLRIIVEKGPRILRKSAELVLRKRRPRPGGNRRGG